MYCCPVRSMRPGVSVPSSVVATVPLPPRDGVVGGRPRLSDRAGGPARTSRDRVVVEQRVDRLGVGELAEPVVAALVVDEGPVALVDGDELDVADEERVVAGVDRLAHAAVDVRQRARHHRAVGARAVLQAELVDELRPALRRPEAGDVQQVVAQQRDAEAAGLLDRTGARRLATERDEQQRRVHGDRAAGAHREAPRLVVRRGRSPSRRLPRAATSRRGRRRRRPPRARGRAG